MSYCVTSVMDTPFLPAEEEQLPLVYEPWMMILLKKKQNQNETFTRSCRSSDSVDVDLGESGGVVVDDNLDRRNIQTSGAAQDFKLQRRGLKEVPGAHP